MYFSCLCASKFAPEGLFRLIRGFHVKKIRAIVRYFHLLEIDFFLVLKYKKRQESEG